MRDEWSKLLAAGSIVHKKEVMAKGMKRPADILLIGWDHGQDMAIDFTVTNPLSTACFPLTYDGAKRHLANAEREKLAKEGPLCAPMKWGFSPVAFSPWGGMGPSAKDLLFGVTKRVVADLPLTCQSARTSELRQTLSLCLVRQVARQLSLRCQVLDDIC